MFDQLEQSPIQKLERRLDNMAKDNEALRKQLEVLEARLLGKNRHRWDVIEKVADYFMGAQVPGDYAEFGVFRGETFSHACKQLGKALPNMHFWAFDSFQGLPQPKTHLDEHDGYSGGFFEGQFACSESDFRDNLQAQKIDLGRITTVPGWYSDTLSGSHQTSAKLQQIAFAWIDCDLYESTVPVLDYITGKLSVGAVILFDDWRCFRNLSDRGQQKACREWLDRNPQIKLNLLIDNDYNGYVFSVAAC